jgi:Reverse transcriptase (RNA-dependent DNA polymerase)
MTVVGSITETSQTQRPSLGPTFMESVPTDQNIEEINQRTLTFRNILNNRYGPDIPTMYRQLDKEIEKYTRVAANLTFLCKCRALDMVPNGLVLKDPCGSRRSRRILTLASKALLRERINWYRYQKSMLTATINSIEERMKQKCSTEDFNRIIKSNESIRKREAEKCRIRHNKKLEELKNKKTPRNANITMGNVVVNRSDRSLTEVEVAVLTKGNNFAISPQSQPTMDVVTSIECAACFLPDRQRSEFRMEIRAAIDRARKPEENVTREDIKALKALKSDDSIIVLAADKGNATVVMNRDEYDTKMSTLINDRTKFKKLGKRNPGTRIEKVGKSLIKKYNLDSKLIEENSKLPHIYGLPKIHKQDVPLRPVVSCIGSSVHPLAKYLVRILNPLQETIQSSVANSKQFVRRIRPLVTTDSTVMVSFDVTSLFTSVPVAEALITLRKFLEADANLNSRTSLNIEQIMELTSFCVNNTVFQYGEEYYSQIEGMAMGSPLSPILCNLFMADLEQEALNAAPYKPAIWLRYVDDTFILWEHSTEKLHEFLEHLNSQNQAIKFTMEVEEDSVLPFLDVKVTRTGNSLSTSVYRKKTHTDRYLHFQSNHPVKTKIGVVKCLQNRARAICQNALEFNAEITKIESAFKLNGYPDRILDRALRQAKHTVTQERTTPVATAVIPYSGSYSEKLKRICHKYNIRVVTRSQDTIGKRLRKVTPHLPIERKKGVIYEIPMTCNKSYIGETGRQLKSRISEHKSACKFHHIEKSGIAEHCISCKCGANWGEVKVLAAEPNRFKRQIRESLEMEKAGHKNYGSKSYMLPRTWNQEFLKRNA